MGLKKHPSTRSTVSVGLQSVLFAPTHGMRGHARTFLIEITTINSPHKLVNFMKELGACPRCNSTDINTLSLYYAREEVCRNCGYVDLYKKRGAQNLKQNFIAYVIIGILSVGGFVAYAYTAIS